MDLDAYLSEKTLATEARLAIYVNGWIGTPKSLLEAVRYSLFAGGKRIRPGLCLGAAEIVGGSAEDALPAACALEMIHTYSLIHDDLPAMDDDDLRRGRPTLHKAHGEAMAILAGDALLTMAFAAAAETENIEVIREITAAAGAAGMVGGQVMDMESEGQHLTLSDLQKIHRAKTGALITGSVRVGAILGNASEAQLNALTTYGEAIGLAFQIADDILDVTGSEEAMGKRAGSDVAHEKVTYPALVGLERAQQFANEAMEQAIAALEPLGPKANGFHALAHYIIDRTR